MSNAQVSDALQSSIELLIGTSRRGRGCGSTDPSAMPALQQALVKAKAAFAAAPRCATPRSPASITAAFCGLPETPSTTELNIPELNISELNISEISTEMILADETAP